MHICILCTYAYGHVYVYAYVHIHLYVYVSDICMYLRIYIYIYIYVDIHVFKGRGPLAAQASSFRNSNAGPSGEALVGLPVGTDLRAAKAFLARTNKGILLYNIL